VRIIPLSQKTGGINLQHAIHLHRPLPCPHEPAGYYAGNGGTGLSVWAAHLGTG